MSSKLMLAVELIFIRGVFYTNKGFKLTSAGLDLESFVSLKEGLESAHNLMQNNTMLFDALHYTALQWCLVQCKAVQGDRDVLQEN